MAQTMPFPRHAERPTDAIGKFKLYSAVTCITPRQGAVERGGATRGRRRHGGIWFQFSESHSMLFLRYNPRLFSSHRKRRCKSTTKKRYM